jgi:hypothetical protein
MRGRSWRPSRAGRVRSRRRCLRPTSPVTASSPSRPPSRPLAPLPPRQADRIMDQTPIPQFSEPNLIGFHNSNLAASTVRIMEGGSWKKQDTVVLLPAAKMVPTKAALSWMNLMTPPNQSCPKIAMLGMEVGDAYSTAIDQVLAHPGLKDHRFILTIEHDNVPPADGLLRLLRQMEAHPEFACIGGLYWTEG